MPSVTPKCFYYQNNVLFSRFNVTNSEEPSFVLENIEQISSRLARDKDSAIIVVYAVNQKGRSAGVIIRDLELGSSASTGSDGN